MSSSSASLRHIIFIAVAAGVVLPAAGPLGGPMELGSLGGPVELGSRAGQAADQPNILFIFIDDLGWTDAGYLGSDFYETPHILKLTCRFDEDRVYYDSQINVSFEETAPPQLEGRIA